MMLSRRRRVFVSVLALASFWPVAFVLERSHLFDIMNALAVAVGCCIVVTYLGAALRAFREEVCTPGHLLVVGIVLAWSAVVTRLVMIWAWRVFDRPPALLDHVLLPFTVWLFVLGGALHLTARNATGSTIPRSNGIMLGIALASGTLLGVAMIVWVK